MANATTTAKITFTTPSPLGGTLAPLPVSLAAPHQAQSMGDIDIPDATADATDFEVPFGSVSEPTLVYVYNKGNQELAVTINGAVNPSCNIPPGGAMLHIAPEAGSLPISALSLATTAEQSGEGRVSFLIVGDPTVDP